MENLGWHPFYYNGLETNIEATKCGRIRRIQTDWMKRKLNNLGEVDFSKTKLQKDGYKIIGVQIKGNASKPILVHQIIAIIFLNHKINGNNLVIDHLNSIKTNNMVENLRIITQRENLSKERSVKSGLPTGVNFIKRNNCFCSSIMIKGKRIFLGYFKDINLATQAYQNALNNINQNG
jgi:hypothetical protein